MSDVTVETPLSQIITNKRRLSALKALGVVSVADALTYYPFRVTDPMPVRPLRQAHFGEKMACAVTVSNVYVNPPHARSGYRLEVQVRDTAGTNASLIFFSHRKSYIDWMASRLAVNTTLVIAGEPSMYNNRLQFTHPEILTVATPVLPQSMPALAFGEPAVEIVQQDRVLKYDAQTVEEALARVCRPRPVYHASSRISSEHIHETIVQLLYLLAGITPAEQSGEESIRASIFTTSQAAYAALEQAIPDILPEKIRVANDLMHRAQAFCAIHDPDSVAQFKAAITTMRFEEAFVCQCALLKARSQAVEHQAYACESTDERDTYIESLPFALTLGQRDVIETIERDMRQDHPMQRLLQGEVGSGKTVVAVSAMLQAVSSGHQAVLVAPTQVLAEQHYQSISAAVGSSVPVLLLTGGMKLAARRKVLAKAASGEPCIVVATHAAFSKSFQAPNLALAVIDEQHRFGVQQRELLREKSERDPHLLVMTATPIPRTAAMTWFGDLDISWLTELPGGRKPIRTFVIPEENSSLMASMFWHARKRIDAGERVYVVCARIDAEDESEDESSVGDGAASVAGAASVSSGAGEEQSEPRPPLHSVEEIAQRLASLPQFAGIQMCTLTGRDDDATKQAVMAGFADGTTPLMIATTVIEVGVDVPQASCIIIFDADRYGLSQLHQLRGRVGRGGTDSWAFLVSRAPNDTIAAERLEVIAGSLDGALIAEKDLELRGAGDVLGDAQSGGKSSLKLLRVVQDARMIEHARQQAQAIIAEDPNLSQHVQLAGAVLDFTRGNEQYLTSN